MRLFEIDESDSMVALNKPWIMLIPEFAELLRRDKGSPGDTQARKKLRATREFTFIYFFKDFTSIIRALDEVERKKEALAYAGLKPEDIDDKVLAALHKYEQLMLSASRSLRTLRSIQKGMDALDKHFETVDFSKTNDDGDLVHSPDKFVKQVTDMNKMYDAYNSFETRVENELKNDTGIRGKGELGDQETTRSEWNDDRVRRNTPETMLNGASKANTAKGTSMMDMLKLVPDSKSWEDKTAPALAGVGKALDDDEDE
jgi:hypothetical protein